jgi:hypothetical protein
MSLTNFNVTPYNDDYDTAKNFHKVLFRPGFSVQARELTQIQSIIQNQVSKFGEHVFEQGSMVIPGDLNYDLEYYYIKVDSIFNAQDVETYRGDFVNKIIESQETGLKAKVIGTVASEGDDPITLYIKYEDSGNDGITQTFGAGETITAYNANNTTVTNPALTANQVTELSAQILTDDNPVGVGSAIQVHKGVYFVNGFFVECQEQTILLEKYTASPSYRIGFLINESFVTPEEDTSLLDNATGSSNANAPGAHRFKIELTLVKKLLESADDTDFIELARINQGKVEKFIKYSDYSQLEHTLARRTYDESGNYEVRPFQMEVREHLNDGTNRGIYIPSVGGDESKLVLAIEPGKAYVEGYELETMTTQFLNVDKPRDFARVNDKPIQTPVGNYVLVENVVGVPEIDEFEPITLYPNLGGGGTSIGSARVRSYILHDGDYGGTLSETRFKLGLFDINMDDGFDFERDVKSFENAGATFTADASAEEITVSGLATSSTGSTTVNGVSGALFTQDLEAGDIIFLNGTFIGQLASDPASNTTLTLTANAAATVTSGAITRFKTPLVRPDQKTLVFPTNFFRVRKIRGDSTANPDNEQSTAYTLRRKFPADGVTGGSVQFTVAGADETFTSTTNLQNYVLVVETATGGSGRSDGDILDITSSNLNLSASDRTLTISGLGSLSTNPTTDGDTVSLIASVRATSSNAVEKSKTLNTGATYDVTTSVAVQNSVITLGKADGYKLTSVKMATSFGAYNSSGEVDITDRYEFDTGMRDAFYDLARIKLRTGQPVPSGSIRVTFDYFTHGAGDYFSVDSYDGVVDYEDIPEYTSTGGDGENYDLRDCLDFRPRIDDSGSNFTNASASITELPAIGTNVEADFSYYLGRSDIVVMDRLGKFDLIPGVPSTNPQKPQEPDSGMTLFEITYEPYVIGLNEVNFKKLDNRRYTMRDIGKLEKRIKNLEYYTALNLLEKETADLVVKDAAGFDRLKNGFIVDNFTGHIIGDIRNEDYRCAIDMTEREVRPMAFTDSAPMIEVANNDTTRSSNNYVLHTNGVMTLPYEEVEYISNKYATDSFDVNPYKVAPFTGEINLVPYSDDWQDTTRRPDVVVNDDNNFDVIRELADAAGVTGTVWNNWQDNWYGRRVPVRTEVLSRRNNTSSSRVAGGTQFTTTQTVRSRQVFTQQVGQVRSGIRTTIQSTVDSQNLGDRIVSMSMIPYMRRRAVSFTVGNMRPNTKVFAFFDNENVSDYARPADILNVSGSGINFRPNALQNPGSSGAASTRRRWNGDFQPGFGFGDVLFQTSHAATNVTNVVKSGTTVTVTLASATNISPGHWVSFSGISGSTQLNYRRSRDNYYRVASKSGNTITITNTDGTSIATVSSYSSGGSCQRYRASVHVAAQGPARSNGTDICVTNYMGGIAVGDVLTGTVAKKSGGVNTVTVQSVNGSTSTASAPSKNTDTTDLVTNDRGQIAGVFYIPNTESLRFRCGDRVFRLIDNINNNPETGLHTSKAEKVYSASGIAEEREQTILNVRRAEFVRDRVQDTRVVSRDVRGAVQTNSRVIGRQFVADPPPPPPPRRRHDPLGQTFINQGDEGAYITKIDLFFQTAGNRPVVVQLVNTIDGHPSLKVIAQKILDVGDINVSDDASAATTFEFDSPVYLKDDVEYAILIKVDEPGCRVFFSEVGQTNLTDNRLVSANPLTGTLFLSQNGSSWTPHQFRDLKFTLYRAKFNTAVVGTPKFVNSTVPQVDLKTNPFECNTGTNVVRVTQPNHGFTDGDLVTISGVEDGVYGANSPTNGIDSEALNDQHTVANCDLDTYTITIDVADITGGTAALTHDFFGGSNVRATRNLVADTLQLAVSQIKLPGTDIVYRWTGMDSGYSKNPTTNIQENDNYYPPTREIVASEENQDQFLNGGRSNNVTTGTSANLTLNMTTTSEWLSPVLDSERVSLAMTSNRVTDYTRASFNNSLLDDRDASSANANIAFNNGTSRMTTSDATTQDEFLTLDEGKEITISGSSSNNRSFTVLEVATDGSYVTLTPSPATEAAGSSITVTQHERYLDGIAPTGTSNNSNYITKRFTLENPATALKILYEANRPDSATLDIYYKIVKEGDVRDFDDIPYVLLPPDETDNPDENYDIFRERTHSVDGMGSYTTAAVKIEMKSTSTIEVPRIKNLRIIALAV